MRLPERWSGRVSVPPVGPDGSPRAKSLPGRPNPELPMIVFRVKLSWETPRVANPAGHIEYGWIGRHLTECTTKAAGTFVMTVARNVNGRAQQASLSFPAKDIDKGESLGTLSVDLPQGIAVRAETGDRLKSDLRAADRNSFVVKLERAEGRVIGIFEGRVEGQATKEGFKAEGAFACDPVLGTP